MGKQIQCESLAANLKFVARCYILQARESMVLRFSSIFKHLILSYQLSYGVTRTYQIEQLKNNDIVRLTYPIELGIKNRLKHPTCHFRNFRSPLISCAYYKQKIRISKLILFVILIKMMLERISEIGFEKVSIWMTLVLILSFSFTWKFFILIQCYVVFLLVTSHLAYNLEDSKIMYVIYFVDFCYLCEIVFTVEYLRNRKIRKLRFIKVREWYCILIDFLSVLPLELLFAFYYIDDEKNSFIRNLLLQNRSLRIYRIVLLESFYATSVRTFSKYVSFVIFKLLIGSVLIAHVCTCIWLNVEQSVSCDSEVFNCFIWYEINMLKVVLHNWSGEPSMFQKPFERIIVTGAILFGFFLIFVYIYPQVLHISLQLFNKKALHYEKHEKLLAFLNNNMTIPENLKNKIIKYFSDLWSKNQYSNVHTMFENIPLALRKEVFTDIYWEAFRHSGLFKEVSRSCKRSLSLVMKTESHSSGEVLYYKGQEKLKMMFLVEGIIEIMAEENENSPLLSFSSGTVFGELSLFLRTRCPVILKCKGYCELQILNLQDVVSVLKNYPKDKKHIFLTLNERLLMAKFTQWRKKEFVEQNELDFLSSDTTFSGIEDCVKWLKAQWRAVQETQVRFKEVIKAREEGSRLPAWRRSVKTDIKIEFISNYLDLIVLSGIFEQKKDVICLQTRFPWSINPSSPFLRVWYYLIVFTSLVPALVYPLCTSWLSKFPWKVYVISYLVTLIFIFDVFLKLFTATKTKHTIITKFVEVLRHKLQNATFYFDIIAALPYQLYIIMKVDFNTAKPYEIGLPLHPAILKSHIFISIQTPLGNNVDKLTILKNSMIYFLLVYWLAEAIQLYSILNLFGSKNDWVQRYLKVLGPDRFFSKYLLSVMRALTVTISISNPHIYPDENTDLVSFCVVKYLFFLFFCYYFGDYYGAITIKIFSWESFQVLSKRVERFLRSKNLSENVTSRILKSLKFQWDYDRADLITSDVSIIKSMPINLQKSLHSKTTYHTLKSCHLFAMESTDFLMEIAEKSELLAVPSGSILITCGQTSHAISIISRGYCQLHSFLIKDINANLGRPVVLGRGQVFPLLSSFCNVPSPISVVSVTDCEMIMINLNDMLQILSKDNFLKDLVSILIEENLEIKLRAMKPALMSFHISTFPEEADRKTDLELFQHLGIWQKLLYFCCPKTNIFTRKRFIEIWDLLFIISNTVICFLLPCCFGLGLKYFYIILPTLTALKVFLLFHMFVRCQTPFFNKKGLLVTHPALTSAYYMSGSFVLDCFRIFPVFVIYQYFFADQNTKPNIYIIICGIFQFTIHLIEIAKYIDYRGNLANERYYTIILKITLLFFLCLNLAANLGLYLYTRWYFEGPLRVIDFELYHENKPVNENLIRKGNVWDHYLLMCFWIISCWNTTDYEIHELYGSQLYLSLVLNFCGTIVNFLVYASFCSNKIVANIWGAEYQERIASFIKFLKYEKADDKIIEKVLSHFDNEWSRTRGENLKEIFAHLPLHLNEEMWHPLYRRTFKKNYLFERADEGFFRILAMHVSSVFFTRGSIIIFKNEVNSYIYFVHRGKCFVYDWFLVLDMGSIIGDLQKTGLMHNKVYALTNVELLKIPSYDFFSILNNFYDLEAYFLHSMKKAENFLKSDVNRVGHLLRLVDSKDAVNAFDLGNKDIHFEDESSFEDPENSFLQYLKVFENKKKEKLMYFTIYPNTWKMSMYTYLYLAISVLTLLCIPILNVFGGLTTEALIILGALDFSWLVYILITFRKGVFNEKTGDIITQFQQIAKNYAKRFDGLFLDLVASLPLEFMVMWNFDSQNYKMKVIAFLRMLRLVRAYSFYKYIKMKLENLKTSAYKKCLWEIFTLLINIYLLTNCYILITEEPTIAASRDPANFKKDQLYAFLLSLEYMINFLASSNLWVICPQSRGELMFFNVTAILGIFLKCQLISKILSIFYVQNLAISSCKSQLSELEFYLLKKDASPIIIEQVITYKTNLLQFSRSENMPSLLNKSPMSLKISIMKDLYIEHLLNCPLFEGLDDIFLTQLIARVKKEIYFPGQLIVEQGDVDNRMYFIHKGEVYVINQTKDRAYVEHVIGRMYAGNFFGEAQGICVAKPHVHTYRGRTVVEMLVLHSDDWADLRKCFPDITLKIYEKAKALRYV